MGGDETPFEGQHYQLARPLNRPQPLTKPHPPIMIGGGGERKTLRFVARYAQACNLFPGPDLARKLDVLREHCEAEGRDYDDIRKTCYFIFDPGEKGEKCQEIVDQLGRLAEMGFSAAIGAVANVWDVTPLEIIGSEIIPAVASLTTGVTLGSYWRVGVPVIAGPGDLAGERWMRVSHADRDQVVTTLQDAFVAGMLTSDELDTRVGRALAARTRGDLAALTGDLPPVPAGRAARPAPAGAAAPAPRRRPLTRASAQAACCVAFAVCMVAIAAHFDPGGPGPNPQHGIAQPFLALAFASLVAAFGVMATGVASAVEQRSDRRRAAAGLPPRSAGPR